MKRIMTAILISTLLTSNTTVWAVGAKQGNGGNKTERIAVPYKLTPPSKEMLATLDKRYQGTLQKERNKSDSKGFNGYNVQKLLREFKYSRDEMITFGLWYLKQAKHPLDYERGAWLILSGLGKAPEYSLVEGRNFPDYDTRSEVLKFAKRGDIIVNEKSRFPEAYDDNRIELLGGKAMTIAASYYANKENPEYSLDRAHSLYIMAGDAGIQKSHLIASYLFQTEELKANFFASGDYGPDAYKHSVEYHFRRAVFACGWKGAVFTKADCKEAKQQHKLAEERYTAAVGGNYWDQPNGLTLPNGSTLTTTQVGMMFLMGVITTALIADAQSGGNTNHSDLKAKQKKFKHEQAEIKRDVDTMAALGWLM